MPYNTRRKSLSLPSLGIQLPSASRAHRSNSKPTPVAEALSHPPKRVKRVHDQSLPCSPTSSPDISQISLDETVSSLPKTRRALEHTPPPSPGDSCLDNKVDTQGINDDIVVAVIEQLEKTGNRPHLVRELATVLASSNDSVAHSANPAALLSSRLSLYLRRPWTALAPCPLAKELIPVHPRKVFFYLTTVPHQKPSEGSYDILTPTPANLKRLTPSLTPSIDQDDIDPEPRERLRISPSPEVELSPPEFDEDHPMSPPTPGESFSSRSSLSRDESVPDHRPNQNRAPSPPLEADEKGFTETATAVRTRGVRLNGLSAHAAVETGMLPESKPQMEAIDETAEMTYRRDQELGYELFGHSHGVSAAQNHTALLSSPMVIAKDDRATNVKKVTALAVDVDRHNVDELRSPESVELEELDGMFSGF